MREKRFGLFDLIVVAIIAGALGAIIYASADSTQARGRDAKRITDIDDIKKALSLYKGDNRRYPIAVSTTTLTGADPISAVLQGTDIAVMPRDPLSPQYEYSYRSDARGSTYYLSFCLEKESIKNYSQGCGNAAKP
jgi:type II secretory pathway pseudopilin PulG